HVNTLEVKEGESIPGSIQNVGQNMKESRLSAAISSVNNVHIVEKLKIECETTVNAVSS
ncbi:MAG: hypothetical protein QOF01_2560, partial [Thermomicrobiales bacterium]|nr:hypothetical protein [Thermomicrobiales bacterium]